jgi:hypothetical protein
MAHLEWSRFQREVFTTQSTQRNAEIAEVSWRTPERHNVYAKR